MSNNLCCVLNTYLKCTSCDWVLCMDCRARGPVDPQGLHAYAAECGGQAELVNVYGK